jgi:CheY-like chemotaxis protein
MQSQQPTRILLVDDDQIIVETLAVILEREGFQTRSFVNPVEALSAARLEAPDLVITDVMMPQFSGIELAIQIKKLWPNCKILLLSGQAHTVDLLRTAREQGHTFHLFSKPIHPNELLWQIREQTLCAGNV